jgi:hypothetical protein
MATLKERIKGKVQFLQFDGPKQILVYQCDVDGFVFYVPLADAMDATFEAEDNAIYFMRWIRKHQEYVTQPIE